ncbi:vasotocin-neurophysin VT-like, partial [Columba livia]
MAEPSLPLSLLCLLRLLHPELSPRREAGAGRHSPPTVHALWPREQRQLLWPRHLLRPRAGLLPGHGRDAPLHRGRLPAFALPGRRAALRLRGPLRRSRHLLQRRNVRDGRRLPGRGQRRSSGHSGEEPDGAGRFCWRSAPQADAFGQPAAAGQAPPPL